MLLGTWLRHDDAVAGSLSREQPLQIAGWNAIPGLAHGFYGRRGGVSRGGYAELNLSRHVGDQADAVRENWRRISRNAGDAVRFVTMRQVHGAHVVTVDAAGEDAGEADALATREAGIGLSVLTADCVPILLVAPQHGVIAAVHAGWRGTLQGIAPRAVHHLQQAFGVGAEAMQAALGPAIGGCCYEVSATIVDELERRWGAMSDAVSRRGASAAQLDLRAANAAQLAASGVRSVDIVMVGPCTRCAGVEYFSHRAAQGDTGRQLSFVAWRP